MAPSRPRSWAPSWGRWARTPPRPSSKTWSTRSTRTVSDRQRPILNFAPMDKLWPPGVSFVP
jgi:hypothetical protein